MSTIILICGFAFLEIMVGFPINIVIGEASSKEDFGKISIYNTIIGVLRYTAMFVVISLSSNPLILIAVIAARRFVELIIAVYMFRSLDFRKIKINAPVKESIEILKYSSFLSVAHLLQTVGVSMGTVFVNMFFGATALGIYRSTFDVVTRVWFFSNGLAIVLFPRLVKMKNELTEFVYYKRINIMTFTSWIGFLWLSAILSLFSENIISLMHIPGNDTHILFILLCVGICLNGHANLSYEILQARGEYLSTVFLSLTSLLLMLITFFTFKNSAGLISIGLAWVISQVAYSMAGDILAVKPSIISILTRMLILSILLIFAFSLIS